MRYVKGFTAWIPLSFIYPLVLYIKHLCSSVFFFHFLLIPVLGTLALFLLALSAAFRRNIVMTGLLVGFLLPILLACFWYGINPSFENAGVFADGFFSAIPNAIGGGLMAKLLDSDRLDEESSPSR